MRYLNLFIFSVSLLLMSACSSDVDEVLNVKIDEGDGQANEDQSLTNPKKIENQPLSNEEVEKIKTDGEAFLAANKKRKGVKTTASGLQYEVMREGFGAKPGLTSRVKVHYHGTTPDGEVFDSSVDRGQPAEFGLNQVIKGWTEGLQLMSGGSKFKFFIPQELAYGANPQPGSIIKPFMPLVFEVELLEILDGPAKGNEPTTKTTMKFDRMAHDYGKIKVDTDNKTSFTVTNTGKNPLIIETVKATCGCTTPKKPEKPIMPGESDKIEVVFHPKENQLDKQKKTVRVIANTEPSETVLTISAFVEKK